MPLFCIFILGEGLWSSDKTHALHAEGHRFNPQHFTVKGSQPEGHWKYPSLRSHPILDASVLDALSQYKATSLYISD